MTAGQGLWGLGIFRHYGCYLGGKLVAGVAGTSPWLLLLEPGANSFVMGLYRQPLPSKSVSSYIVPQRHRVEVLYEMSLTPSQWLPEFLRNDDYARLIAAPFLLSLPAVARITVEDVARGYKALTPETFDDRIAAIAPPNRVELASLSALKSPRQSRTAGIGRGVLTDEGDKTWGWRLYDTARRFPSDDLYISTIGAADVRAQLAEAINRTYTDTMAADDPYLLASALKGTVNWETYANSDHVAPFSIGMRYGRDIDGSEAQFGVPIATFGAVIESRKGFSKGLRGFFDQTPTVTNDETEVEYGARRMQVGRNFSLKVPLVLDRVELTPRVGVWDINSKVLLNDPVHKDVQYVLPVTIRRAVGVGVEGGAIFSAANFVGKVWGSKDLSVGGKLDRYAGGSVEGTRFGADGIYRLLEVGSRRSGNWLAPMLFVLKEDVTIKSSNGHAFQRGDKTVQFNQATIAYEMTYIGGGLALIF